jgi:restriction endonuclease S subunit
VSAQPNINFEQIKSLKIPIPPKNIQAEIVAKMDKAYQEKQTKETQAQKLLASIDTYLLGELGINLPKQTDNSLTARIFTKKFSDIEGGRFDCKYYQKKYIDFDHSLNNTKYRTSNIGDIITSIVSGSTPKSGGNAYQDNGKYHFIRLTNFNNSMEVDLSKALFIKKNIHYGCLQRSRLTKGDVLFGIAGSIGKIAIYNDKKEANINQAIARLRFKNNVNYIYTAYLLNSGILKYQIERNKRPVAQPNLNTEELKSLKIPLPPLEKQDEIAKHISQIRDQVKQLQLEAKTGLEQAKQQIETMILGSNL